MIELSDYLMFSSLLFACGVAGILVNGRNLLILLMSIELILLAVNTNFIAFSSFLSNLDGQLMVFFILTVAASEAAIGLAIIVVLFRRHQNLDVGQLSELKG